MKIKTAHAFSNRSSAGFTLLELVVALGIAAILSGFIAMMVSTPLTAYFDQSDRARLSDSAEVIARTLREDFRHALPNSVRIRSAGSRAIVEMLVTDNVSFYVAEGELGMPAQPTIELSVGPSAMADQFQVFGRTAPVPSKYYLVLGHRGSGVLNADAYRMQDVIITSPTSGQTGLGKYSVQLPPGFAFAAHDSLRRIFWVTEPVTYICNAGSTARSLRRYHNYNISSSLATSEASSQLATGNAQNELVATNIGACSVRCENGASASICEGTLILEISLVRAISGGNEVISVVQQFPMDNRT